MGARFLHESFTSGAGAGLGSRRFLGLGSRRFLGLGSRRFLGLLILLMAVVKVSSKECTNIPTPLSTHTRMGELMTTKNSTRRAEEMAAHFHLTPTDDSAWLDLLPGKGNRPPSPKEAFDWAMLYRKLKGSGAGAGAGARGLLEEVSLEKVRLDPSSLQGRAQQTNLEYLLMLDVDRLVWSFRKQAGLPASGDPYGGWEAPDVELRGHFVGHYMSASAQLWASTYNGTLYERMSSVVDALYECQIKMGTGYLSAFPTMFFDLFEAIRPVWAPYYTIHKIMSGLVDQYMLAKNKKALNMVNWMAEYFSNRVKNVIQTYTIERHWMSLNEETGGMNDILYRLYSITGNPKHLVLAHLFDKPCFLGLLAVQADSLSGFHTNTHIPIVIGAQMRYEITGDPLYKEIGISFMDIVNSSHTYATGGTSFHEKWYDPKHLAETLAVENEESCTTYNMLKVSRNLFRWTKEIAYADHYERALTNGVLSIQRGVDPGVMIYMLPLGPGQSKARSYHGWGTKFDSFWCCYGTGIESFSKLGDSIYFEEKGSTPGLYIIQFVSSSLNWETGGIVLNMKVNDISSSDPFLRATLSVSHAEQTSRASTMNLRIPSWTSLSGAKATLNSQNLVLPGPGNFLSITRQWALNDIVSIQLPMGLRTEPIKDDRAKYASVQAILFGPYLLAGLTSGDWDLKGTSASSVSDSITAVPTAYNSQLISLYQEGINLVFSNSNGSLSMAEWPEPGTDSSAHATFRLIINHRSSTEQVAILEPFDLPGMAVVDQGPGKGLTISFATEPNFRIVRGLNTKKNSVSFESLANPGCFIHGGSGKVVELLCRDQSKEDGSFQEAASFVVEEAMRKYHPISFIVKGVRRGFLLEPLLNLRDESYTVYFNFGS